MTICHRTNSNTNPYVVITPDVSGVLKGHEDHDGPLWNPTLKAGHEKWGDIIPAFEYNGVVFPGQNLANGGQAMLNNGCQAPIEG